LFGSDDDTVVPSEKSSSSGSNNGGNPNINVAADAGRCRLDSVYRRIMM